MVTRPLRRRRGSRRSSRAVPVDGLADLGEQFVTHHVVTHVDGRGEAFRIGAAVALDDDAVEAEEHAAVGFARIHLVAQHAERRRAPADSRSWTRCDSRDRALEIIGELARGALRRLQRDVAGEAFGHHHVDRALADVVAFDEADVVDMRQRLLAQDAAGLAHRLEPLDLLDADVEQPDGRPVEIEQHARHRAAHHRHVDQMLGVGADRGAEIEHDGFAPQRRPERRDRRPLDARQRACRLNLAIAISAPVLPAETATSASPFLTASMASHIDDFQRPLRSAWLGLSSMRTATSVCTSRAASLSRGCGGEQRLDLGPVAEQDEFAVGMPRQRQSRRRARRPTARDHPPWRRARCGPSGAWIDLRRRRWRREFGPLQVTG